MPPCPSPTILTFEEPLWACMVTKIPLTSRMRNIGLLSGQGSASPPLHLGVSVHGEKLSSFSLCVSCSVCKKENSHGWTWHFTWMAELDISLEWLALLLFNSHLRLLVRNKSTWTQMKARQSWFGTWNEIFLKMSWSWLRESSETLPFMGDDYREALRGLLFCLGQIMN